MQIHPSPGALRRRLLLACLPLALVHPGTLAQPAAYPSRPIQLVVAAPAGGPSDALARMLADDMGKQLGQPVVIDNKPGGAGTIAAEAVARAPADGHTLMLSWIGNATSQALVSRQPVDIQRDFVHITQLVAGANVLVAHPSTGFKTLQDLLAFAKAHPARLSYASAGNGSSGHLAMEMLKQRSAASLLHIPYRGGAPALNDLLAGQVQVMFLNQDGVLAHVRAGRLVALAITSAQRNTLLPTVPTVAESGYSGFEATAWAGLSAPRGTPPAVVNAIHAAAVKSVNGTMKDKQEAVGAQIVGSNPAQFEAFVRAESEKWSRVIKSAGIRPD